MAEVTKNSHGYRKRSLELLDELEKELPKYAPGTTNNDQLKAQMATAYAVLSQPW